MYSKSCTHTFSLSQFIFSQLYDLILELRTFQGIDNFDCQKLVNKIEELLANNTENLVRTFFLLFKSNLWRF